MLENILTEQACEQLRTLVHHSETIICVSHRSPDGDAIGSCLGFAECLRMMGKQPQVIIPDLYPDFLQWLPNSEKIIRYDKHKEGCDWTLKHADLIVCLDINTLDRTGEMAATLKASPAKKIIIDHHLNPDIDAAIMVSRPKASSTCELVFRLAWQLGLFEQANKHFAVPVYCGMMTDTGGFTFNSNDPDIFFIIGQLLTKQIKGLKLSISLREDTEKENLIWVSLRSVDDFPCNEMAAQFFNGGGHLNASGGRLECSLDEAVEITKRAFQAFADKLAG